MSGQDSSSEKFAFCYRQRHAGQMVAIVSYLNSKISKAAYSYSFILEAQTCCMILILSSSLISFFFFFVVSSL